ncbi:TPA: hypothetical protein ACXOO6_003322 [Escherichia coli]
MKHSNGYVLEAQDDELLR